MNFKQKCFYMGLGCVFALLGYTLATLNNDVTAQSQSMVVDEIVCRSLAITNAEGTNQIALGHFENLTGMEGGVTGMVIIGKDGEVMFLGIAKVEKQEGRYLKGGCLVIGSKSKNEKVYLGIDEIDGPRLEIANKGKENVLQAGVSDTGSGVIVTRDKHGYKTGSLP